jgi:hypothetical protein
MSVGNLETPERGMNLQTRAKKGAAAGPDGLRERIEGARDLKPEAGFCCSHCAQAFTAGRDAAIRAIEE